MDGDLEEGVMSDEEVWNADITEARNRARNMGDADIMIRVGVGRREEGVRRVVSGNRHKGVRVRQGLIQGPLAERNG
jgi:hypothetical protein